VNLGALAVALLAVSMASRRAGLLLWASIAQSFFLLSGPVLRYMVEGRAYIMALSASFVAAWYCALAIEVRDRRPSARSFALIGLIGALTHLFAALICGCLAAGLVALSLLGKRKELLAPGLTLGVSASLVTILWLPFVIGLVHHLDWIDLSFESVLRAYWENRLLAGLGPHLAVLLAISLFATGLMLPPIRSLTAAFALAGVLFWSLPILISLAQPLILGRWWSIGAPCVVVYVVWVTRALFAHGVNGIRGPLFALGCLAGAGLLVVTSINGFAAARRLTAAKMIWSGAKIAAPLLARCPRASVHVGGLGFIPGYAFVARVSTDVFTSADAPDTPWIGAGDSTCPVLGWAEHVIAPSLSEEQDYVFAASDDQLLQWLKIRALPSEVEIHRHQTGFVILRRHAPTAN
jgi:hypothetical protein